VLGGTTKHILALHHLDLFEASGIDLSLQLDFEKSTSDTTFPQRNIALGTLRYGLLRQNISDLNAASGPESAYQFPLAGHIYRF
jgi:hypothetical protein